MCFPEWIRGLSDGFVIAPLLCAVWWHTGFTAKWLTPQTHTFCTYCSQTHRHVSETAVMQQIYETELQFWSALYCGNQKAHYIFTFVVILNASRLPGFSCATPTLRWAPNMSSKSDGSSPSFNKALCCGLMCISHRLGRQRSATRQPAAPSNTARPVKELMQLKPCSGSRPQHDSEKKM